MEERPITYKDAGVDISAGEETVNRIRKMVQSTFSDRVLTDIGLFGAFYDAHFPNLKHPVLVSSVDGVGTKLKVACMTDRHDTVGQDLVNHCVNDILVCGATPLFFMDYLATGKLNPDVAEKIVGGFVKACNENRCSLVGGETAEMPGFYQPGEYDLAGTIVGIVEKERIVKGDRIRQGNVLIGLPSTGLHTNGYSLARAVLFRHFKPDSYVDELGATVGEELLKIHRSYLNPVSSILAKHQVLGLSHITGGGIVGNTTRILPRGLDLQIDWHVLDIPPIFKLIQNLGSVPEEEMRRTFNLGVGLILVVDKNDEESVMSGLREIAEKPFVMGTVVAD
jgi:phosphoribosylformylglycinamidine cyclo-ligase